VKIVVKNSYILIEVTIVVIDVPECPQTSIICISSNISVEKLNQNLHQFTPSVTLPKVSLNCSF